jgi:hypothetical protein
MTCSTSCNAALGSEEYVGDVDVVLGLLKLWFNGAIPVPICNSKPTEENAPVIYGSADSQFR